MTGGFGNDNYVVHNSGCQLIENPGGGTDIVYTYVNFILADNVENLLLAGSGHINGTGGGGNNVITGNSGNNVLTGGGGNDHFVEGLDFGIDRIADFNVLSNSLSFSSAMFTDFNDLMNHTVDSANGAVITFDVDNIHTFGLV